MVWSKTLKKNVANWAVEVTMKIQLTAVEVPEQFCWWFHPDIWQIDPLWECEEERGYTVEEWEQIQANGNVDISIQTYAYEDVLDISEEDVADWSKWKPNPPSPDHFLIAAFDTEDSDIVLWWAKQRLPKL